MKLLFTGFDPFGGEDTNASYEAVRRLPDTISGAQIVKAQIPTEYRRAVPTLIELIEKEAPDALICVGQAAGRGAITPEKVGINFADARIPDNAGFQPIDALLCEDGDTAYFATLPVRALVDAMNAAEIPASVSYTAGTFVCNCVLYHMLRYAKENAPQMKVGFIHVPLLPSQVKPEKPLPSMELSQITEGLRIIGEVLAKN